MRVITFVLFTAFFCTLFSCNNKKGDQREEQVLADTLIVEDEIIDDYQEEEYVSYVPSINLFTTTPIDTLGVIFISLSDIYPLSEHPDSVAVPIVEEKGFDESEYMKLESKYRKQFLSKTDISETDSVFVYDYSTNHLKAFLVKDLNVVAKASIYVTSYEWPFSQYEYEIGFEVDLDNLEGIEDHVYDILVYVGKENPFVQEQLTFIEWKKIASKQYPSKEVRKDQAWALKGSIAGDTYLFETDSLQFYLQDYYRDRNEETSYDEACRRLLVVESSTKEIIVEQVFGKGEGASPSLLNSLEEEIHSINQWTGKLLKDKAPVVFGFEYNSFGCSYITILDKSDEIIYLQCDNRH